MRGTLQMGDALVAGANWGRVRAMHDFIGKRAEVRHHHFRFALEPRAKHFILRGNADGAGIQMALPRHHASDRQQRRRAEAEFVGAQNCRENNVPGEFQASVHTEREP